MAKIHPVKIGKIKFFEFFGKNVQLTVGDRVVYYPPNGKPASFSFFRKDDPILFRGHQIVEHEELETPELFKNWFKDCSKLLRFGVDLDFESMDADGYSFKIVTK